MLNEEDLSVGASSKSILFTECKSRVSNTHGGGGTTKIERMMTARQSTAVQQQRKMPPREFAAAA